MNIRRPRGKCKFNHDFFEIIDNEAKAYWFGFLMADGGISDTQKKGCKQLRIHLSEKDKNHLFLFRDAIHSNNKIQECKKSGKISSVRISHSSDKLCDDLISLGCTPRKSLTLKFPNISESLLHHFCRGYFDGDGCACISDNRLFLSMCGTEEFLEKTKNIMEVSHLKTIKRKNNNIHNLQISNKDDTRRIYEWMYKDATVYLKRKKDVIEEGLKLYRPGRGNFARKPFIGIRKPYTKKVGIVYGRPIISQIPELFCKLASNS